MPNRRPLGLKLGLIGVVLGAAFLIIGVATATSYAPNPPNLIILYGAAIEAISLATVGGALTKRLQSEKNDEPTPNSENESR